MKSFFFLTSLLFCLLTVITNGQNFLPRQTIENINKNKSVMQNPAADLRTNEKTMGRDMPRHGSLGQGQISTINLGINKKKNTNTFKLNGSMYRPVTAVVDDTLRYTYTYDNNGNMLTRLTEIWTNNAWENSSRSTYTYDNNGNMLTRLTEIWTNNAWENSSRSTYTYDNNGNMLTELFERWTNNAWENSSRSTYTYDNNGNMLTQLKEQWTNNAWVNDWRYTSTYDNNGNELTWLSEIWTNNAWVNAWRYTNTYDNNGNMLTLLNEQWTNNAWVNEWRETSTYDNNGNMLTWLSERWTNNAWVNVRRYTYTYDNNGNMLTRLNERWTNNAWENSSRYTSTYDNNWNAIKGEYFEWLNNAWVTAHGYFSLSYNSGADYISFFGGVVNVTYTLIITDIKDNGLTANTYSLQQNYPNPFNPSTVIQYALPYESNVKITVYNALGEIVKTFNEGTKQTGSYNINFNGEGLSSGIYLYTINAVSVEGKQNFQATKKMILIK